MCRFGQGQLAVRLGFKRDAAILLHCPRELNMLGLIMLMSTGEGLNALRQWSWAEEIGLAQTQKRMSQRRSWARLRPFWEGEEEEEVGSQVSEIAET